MNTLCRLLLAVLLGAFLTWHCPAEANSDYNEEITLEVGTAWKLEVPRVLYNADNKDICELLKNEDDTYSILMTKPGDVVVTAYIPEDGKLYYVKYLIHIVEGAAPQGGQAAAASELQQITREEAAEMLRLVNLERSKAGARPLRLNEELMAGCAVRARELPVKYSHERPDGSSCFTVLGSNYRALGENIAAGQDDTAAVMESWMNSPGHRSNILNKEYTEFGIGHVYDPNSPYGNYWVQLFRR